MRILLATPLLPPDVGGPATYSALLIQNLPRHGIEVSVAYFGSVRHFPPGVRHLVYFFKLLSRARGVDLIFALDPVSVGFPAALATLITHKPLILKVVGDYAWEQGVQRFGITSLLDEFLEQKHQLFMVRVLRTVQAFVARRARRIITPSAYLKSVVERWGVDPGAIEVIPNGVPDLSNVGSKEVIRSLLALKGHLIVSAGRLVPWKGFRELIELMPKLRKKVPDARLLIVGDGPDRALLEATVEKLRLEEYVSLAGRLPHSVLMRYVAAADLFVLNTAYEGLSHQVLEALAVGAPVVTTRVGGNPEVITDKKNGLLVPHGDSKALQKAMEKMLTDAAGASKFSAVGRVTARRFSEEGTVQKTAHFLRTCVS